MTVARCLTHLKIVDSDDATLFDLDDPTGDSNPYGVKTSAGDLDFGPLFVDQRSASHGQGIPGVLSLGKAFSRTRRVSWPQAVLGADDLENDLRSGLNRLAELLHEGSENGNRLKWQATDATDARYIKWVSVAELPAIVAGQPDSIRKVFDAGLVVQTLGIDAQPLVEWAPVISDTQTVSTDPATATIGHMGRIAHVENPGSGPARVVTRIAGGFHSGGPISGFYFGLISEEVTALDPLIQLEGAVAGTNAAPAAVGATASGTVNDVMRVTFVNPAMVERMRVSTGLGNVLPAGRYLMVLRALAATGAVAGDIQITAAYQYVIDTAEPEEAVAYNFGGVEGQDIPLGFVDITEDATEISFLIEASRTSGSSSLDFDLLYFLRVDEASLRLESEFLRDGPGGLVGEAHVTLVVVPPGQGSLGKVQVMHSVIPSALAETGVLVAEQFDVLRGDIGFWIPPGTSTVQIIANEEAADGRLIQSDLSRTIEVAFEVTAHDLIA